MFPELIIMEKLKYVQPWVKGLFSGNIPAVPLPGKLKNFIINWGTLTQDQSNLSIVEVYKIQISKVSSTTEKANGELLFTKPAATYLGRNSGNAEKGCSSQNNTKQQQQTRVLNQFVFSR